MFVGHYGVAFLLKGFFPLIPLNLLFLACMLPDLLFFLNMATSGIEYAQLDKNLIGLVMPYRLEMEYSHSVLGVLFLGLIIMIIFVLDFKLIPLGLFYSAT
jgi:hypothetical protein